MTTPAFTKAVAAGGKLKTYGWDAVRLSELSYDEINALRLSVESDPKSANPAHASGQSIYLYTKAAMRKLDALAWAVFYKQQAAAKARAA